MDVYLLCLPKTCSLSFHSLELGWECSLGRTYALGEALEAVAALFPSASLFFPKWAQEKKIIYKKKSKKSSAPFSHNCLLREQQVWGKALCLHILFFFYIHSMWYDTPQPPQLCCVGGRVLIPVMQCVTKSQNVAQHISVDCLDSSFKSSNVNLNEVSQNHLF